MRIAHTKSVRLFREVTGVEQALVQKYLGTVEETYMTDIRNRTKNYINNAVVGVLMHLQDKYGQFIPHNILEREDIVKKTIYNPRNPIVTVLSAVEELFDFSDITGTSYTQLKAVNIAYVILHRTEKSRLAICEWNLMPELQKTWVRFKQFFLGVS